MQIAGKTSMWCSEKKQWFTEKEYATDKGILIWANHLTKSLNFIVGSKYTVQFVDLLFGAQLLD